MTKRQQHLIFKAISFSINLYFSFLSFIHFHCPSIHPDSQNVWLVNQSDPFNTSDMLDCLPGAATEKHSADLTCDFI